MHLVEVVGAAIPDVLHLTPVTLPILPGPVIHAYVGRHCSSAPTAKTAVSPNAFSRTIAVRPGLVLDHERPPLVVTSTTADPGQPVDVARQATRPELAASSRDRHRLARGALHGADGLEDGVGLLEDRLTDS